MALKSRLTAEDWGKLPEVLQAEYTKDGDGYVLDADITEHPRAKGLHASVQATREERDKLKADLKALADKLGDLDPEKAREAMRRVRELDEKKLLDEGKVEELFAKRTERMVADHANEIKARDAKIAELEQAVGAMRGKLSEVLIDNAIAQGATSSGVKASGLAPLLLIAKHGLPGGKVPRWELDGDKPVPKNPDGTVSIGKDGKTAMGLDEWFSVARSELADLFEPSRGSGAAGAAGTPNGAGGRFVLTREQAKDFATYKRAAAEAEKAGQVVTIVD